MADRSARLPRCSRPKSGPLSAARARRSGSSLDRCRSALAGREHARAGDVGPVHQHGGANMHARLLTAAALATGLLAAPLARAEETTTVTKDSTANGVTVQHGTETTGTVVAPSSDCKSKTTQKTNEFGDTKTEHKEKCD